MLLIRVTPVTVTDGIMNAPVRTCALVLKVCTPLPAVNVPLLVIPPWNVTAELPELFHVDVDATVTRPVNVLVPVEEVMINDAAPADPTWVAPPTENVTAPTETEVPFPTVSIPAKDVFPETVTAVVPEVATLFSVTVDVPPIAWTAPTRFTVPLPGVIVPLLVRLPDKLIVVGVVSVPALTSKFPVTPRIVVLPAVLNAPPALLTVRLLKV